MSRFERVVKYIIDFFFPTTCIVCGKGEKIICENCFSDIPKSPKDKINILSVYEYRNKIVNELLWKLKYQHSGDVAQVFAKSVSLELKNWLKDLEENFQNGLQIIFIPAPLNKNDRRIHNHAELLGREIAKYFPGSQVISDLLEKNSEKKQAHTKNKHERMGNIENTIYISKKSSQKLFEKKLIIIVDDVTTTGSTICNIRDVLANYLTIPEDHILAVTIAH
jgi:ComF family protein